MENIVFDQIKKEIASHDVVLFMKGTGVFPQCGFSAAVVQTLSEMGVSFKDINILEDQTMRQAIKDFSQWPTIPQLYVKGEFVGGCDIVREMAETGELAQMFDAKGISHSKAA
ncbi:MAG: Grx4 family monothiol glutaredoxin [Alphaproteobacteria bacterium]|nr:Grx4 family monothiol glutaredoxin [Alphaproteobacteria bacterium]NCQ87488.1 Grx4 family monothiol glutaredoxin [Alphaproteobacteria bacterium]NCT06359.1 Grx4 family monothiol glutaredoxin [Alphaproteobacteria bacterium]